MTLRRYAPMKQSAGSTIPSKLRAEVRWADDVTCVGPKVGMAGGCLGQVELDHVRASGAVGKKSPTERSNLVSLCGFHHRVKTFNGRTWRPVLLAYIAQRDSLEGVSR